MTTRAGIVEPERRPAYVGGALAGVMAGILALLASAAIRLSGGPVSLPEQLFDAIVVSTPGHIESLAISRLRHAAKPLLLAGSTGIILVACAATGVVVAALDSRRGGPTLYGRVALWTISPFALGGALAGLVRAGGDRWQGLTAVVAAQAVFAGGMALWRLGRGPIVDASGPIVRRRDLLRMGANLAFVAAVGTFAAAAARGVWVRGRRPKLDVAAVERPGVPQGVFQRPELTTLVAREVTPTPLFYRVSKNALDPAVDADRWRLAVGGLVGRPLELGLNDLKRLPRLERYHTLTCISNEIGDGLIGNARWSGVRLVDVLELAQVAAEARHVNFHCADGYVESISMDLARTTLLTYTMNGGPLEDRHGLPLRALVPGTYGMKNPKWITRIDAAASPEQGFWNKLGWDAGAPPRIFSRIDVPQARVVAMGDVVLGGIAFAGNRGISRVEVSSDGGETWHEAELRPPLSANAWVLWATVWRPGRNGDHVLTVRATDGAGTTQSPEIRSPFPSGVSGYHRMTVTVEGGKP